MVEVVPEISQAAALARRHAEVVDLPREVRLAGHTDRYGICDAASLVRRATIITVRLMIARANHVRPDRRDARHLVVKVVQDALIDSSTAGDGRVGEVSLDFFFEPIVRIGNVARVPEQIPFWLGCGERLDRVVFTGVRGLAAPLPTVVLKWSKPIVPRSTTTSMV